MTIPFVEDIEAAALQLPADKRAQLAERLLASLEKDDEILAAWVEEAERRADALERGEEETRPALAVLSTARHFAAG